MSHCAAETADTNIYLDGNDKHEAFDITKPDDDTGEDVVADGLTTLSVHYAAARGGAAIHADLTESLTEYAGTAGRYHATMEGSAITAQLAGYAGQRIFAVLTDSAGNVKGSVERFVQANRTF